MDVEKLSAKEKEIHRALAGVKDPELGFSITEAELVDEVKLESGEAHITYHLTAPFCPPVFALYIGREIRKRALEVNGVERVEVTVKDHVQAEAINKALRQKP